MKSRHFSLAQLLRQLHAEDIKIALSSEETKLSREEQRKLREQKKSAFA